MWTAANLQQEKHCFFGAAGGVSEGIYKGLNVNTKSDDRPEHLDTNLDRAASSPCLARRFCWRIVRQGLSVRRMPAGEGRIRALLKMLLH